jgi:hypothetical protein
MTLTVQDITDAAPGYRWSLSNVSQMLSTFNYLQQRGGGGVYPLSSQFPTPAMTPGTVCDSTKTGALPLPSVLSGHKIRVSSVYWPSNYSGMATFGAYYLGDRLVEVGGIDLQSTAVQTINSVALPSRAPANGIGVQMFLMALAQAGGSTTPTWVVNYTNDQGTSSTTTYTTNTWGSTYSHAGGGPPPIPLAAGDKGVQSVQSIQNTGTASGTAATGALLLVKPILLMPGIADTGPRGGQEIFGWMGTGLAEIDPDACLQVVYTVIDNSGSAIGYSLIVD